MSNTIHEEIFWAILRNDTAAIKALAEEHGHTKLIQRSIRMYKEKRGSMLGHLLIERLSEEQIQRLLFTPEENRAEINGWLSEPLSVQESLIDPDKTRKKTDGLLMKVSAEQRTNFFRAEFPREFNLYKQDDTLSKETIERMIADRTLSQRVCNTIANLLVSELARTSETIASLLNKIEEKMHKRVSDLLMSALGEELQLSFFGSDLSVSNNFSVKTALDLYMRKASTRIYTSDNPIEIERFFEGWQKELLIVFGTKFPLKQEIIQKILDPTPTESKFPLSSTTPLIKKAILSLDEIKPLWEKKLELAELKVDRQREIDAHDLKMEEKTPSGELFLKISKEHAERMGRFDSQIAKKKEEIKDLIMSLFEQYEEEFSLVSPKVREMIQAKEAYETITNKWKTFAKNYRIQISEGPNQPFTVDAFFKLWTDFIKKQPENTTRCKYSNLSTNVEKIYTAVKRIALRKLVEKNWLLFAACFASLPKDKTPSIHEVLESIAKSSMQELLTKFPNIDAQPDKVKEKMVDALVSEDPLSTKALIKVNELLSGKIENLKNAQNFYENNCEKAYGKFYSFPHLTANLLEIVLQEKHKVSNEYASPRN